jgi:hypothetical protein
LKLQRNIYYPYWVTTNRTSYILLWYTDEEKGDIFFKKDNSVYIGQDKKELKKNLPNEQIIIKWQEAAEINIDKIESTIIKTRQTHKMSARQKNFLINAWNFFDDLERTLGTQKTFSKTKKIQLDKIYDKLFWGANIPSLTKEKKASVSIWSDEDINALQLFFKTVEKPFTAQLKKYLSIKNNK